MLMRVGTKLPTKLPFGEGAKVEALSSTHRVGTHLYVTEVIISVQLDFLGFGYNSLQHYRPLPSSLYVLTTWPLEQVAVADCAALWRAVHTLIVRRRRP